MINYTDSDIKFFKAELKSEVYESILPHMIQSDKENTLPEELLNFYKTKNLFEYFSVDNATELRNSLLYTVAAAEAVSQGCAGFASVLSVNFIGQALVFSYLDDKNRDLYIDYLNGSKLIGYAGFYENSYIKNNDLPVTYKDDGAEVVINGEIKHVLLGSKASAIILTAEKETEDTDKVYTTFFLDISSDGVEIEENLETIGLCCLPVNSIKLRDVRIPRKNILGLAEKGLEVQKNYDTIARLYASAIAAGIIKNSYLKSYHYSREREQFGVNIGSFQAIEDMMIDMKIAYNACESMISALINDILNDIVYAECPAAEVKLFAAEAAMKSAIDSVQIHGGYGYMKDYPVEKLFRDAKMLQICFGTPHLLKRLIANKL
ncbi:acyl-CoA dehydrogenase family protein [candidate division KSB1 bacterium]